ncbi:MAG: hypothetical protein SGARI_001611 [Bacillariaceae sp.]
MFHWHVGESKDETYSMNKAIADGVTVDKTKLFDSRVSKEMNAFSKWVQSLFLETFPSVSKESDGFSALFGLFQTDQATHQCTHIDAGGAATLAHQLWEKGDLVKDSWRIGYSLHLPLSLEGAALKLGFHSASTMADGPSDPTKYSDMILKTYMIPFGSALLIRNDLPHSGTYGSQDNTRLYMGLYPSNIDKHVNIDAVTTIPERNFGSNESDGMDPIKTLAESPSIHVVQKFRSIIRRVHL